MQEVTCILQLWWDCLVEELAAVGLNLATPTTNLNEPMFLNISGDMIEIRHGEQNHKYL